MTDGAGWQSLVTAITTPPEASRAQPEPRRPGSPRGSGPTPMGLQFELREQTPHTPDRWNGPTAKTARPTRGSEAAGIRLGVRPVMRNANGTWVKGILSWNNFAFQSYRLGLIPEHQRWFSQLAALHKALRGSTFRGQESDWVYLDDFASPLLWPLLEDAARLGIPLLTTRKDGTVTVAREATVSLDACSAEAGAGDLQLGVRITIDGTPHPAEGIGSIGTHGLYRFGFGQTPAITLAPTTAPLTDEQKQLIERGTLITVPAAEVPEFLSEYYPLLRSRMPVGSSDDSVSLPEIVPATLVLTATFAPKHTLHLAWAWDYPPFPRVPVHAEGEGAGSLHAAPRDATQHAAPRDTVAEAALRARAETITPLEPVTLTGIDAAEFAEHTLPSLRQLERLRVETVGTPPDYRELTAAPALKVTTVETDQRDWFDLGVLVTVEGHTIPFGPLFAALAKGRPKLLLIDGSYLSLRQPVFESLQELINEARALQEWETGLRISRFQASLWADFEDLAEQSEPARRWRETVGGLLAHTATDAAAGSTPAAPVPLPDGLRAELRPYQRAGYDWLVFLWRHGLGGILGDDMGLGKTLQTLALVSHARQHPAEQPSEADAGQAPADAAGPQHPFLVVAPTSVVSNWVTEAARFTPNLTVVAITSTQAKSGTTLADAIRGADLVITSYALFRLDADAYRAEGWAGLILDEAQFVKNPTSKAHECALDLDTPFKLAITGTPMENHLGELWALFAIVAPGLFPSARKFAEQYKRPIEGGEGAEQLARLRRRIRPLMLRRTKELVAADLPAKQEQVLHIDLAPKHRTLYDTFLQRERQKLLGLLDDMDKNRFIVFRSLTLLRMLSLDPSLIDEKYSGVPSSKLDALFEQLEDVLAEGHRTLIFSQFTSFLKKAADRLDKQGVDYAYLDGSTRNRADVIAGFTNGTAPVFLISLKAGGFGLNLTEADYVFLLDPWWNPASETQAIDRTHRIGQTRNVMVYRMVATGTIEEKVMALKERKAKLFSAMFDDDAVFSADITADDIRELLE